MVPRKPKITDLSMTVVTFLWHTYHSCAEGMPNKFRLDKARTGVVATRLYLAIDISKLKGDAVTVMVRRIIGGLRR
jgi:hypothetical protein